MIELVAKYLSGNASLDEQRRVEEWRNENSEEFLAMSEAWSASNVEVFSPGEAQAAVMARIATQSRFDGGAPGGTNFSLRNLGIAASIALVLGVAYFFFAGGNTSSTDSLVVDGWVVVETDASEKREVTLPDGSVVSLSERSSVSFPEQFADERKVVFNGKAFFDIAPDSEHPFKVETTEALITVVGTSFQVKTEQTAKYSEVIVETGVVTLTKRPQPNVAEKAVKVELFPGESGVVRRESGGVAKSKNMNQNYLAWKTNKIVFNRTKMSEVVETLNEVYGVEVTLLNREIANCRLTATFDGKPVSEVMEVVGQTFDFEIASSKGKFEINGKACQ